MQRTICGFAAAALVGALAWGVIDTAPAQAAAVKQQQAGTAVSYDLSARRRHHRYHRRYYRRGFSYRYVGAPCWYYGSCYRYRYYRSPRRYYYRRHYYPRSGVYFYFRF